MKQLLVQLNELGVKLHLEGEDLRITAPQGALTAELRQALREHKATLVEALRTKKADVAEALPEIEPDSANAGGAFPLSDLQHAYWLGRVNALELGNVATHIYTELDSQGLDLWRLEASLNRMVQRHGILRAVVDHNGLQRILPEVPPYRIEVVDVCGSTPEEAEQAIGRMRAQLSHQVFKPEHWPMFDIRLTQLPGGRQRMHISLDMLIMDGHSIGLFFGEWTRLYAEPQLQLPAIAVSYRDYILAEQRLRESASYRRAHDYWMDRVETLPAAPDLPVRAVADPAAAGKFVRRGMQLDSARWQQLKGQAKALGLTPSSLVLAMYAEVLSRWGASPHFTLNLTLGNRLPLHQDVRHLLGNFSSLLLQEVDRSNHQQSFIEFALGLQKRFMANYDHRQMCGVSVMREWSKRRRNAGRVAMPVVYTSGLVDHAEEGSAKSAFGPRIYTESQTSQVWLDHVASEAAGCLCLDWYTADAVFEPGVVDAMFGAYCELVERLAADPSLLHSKDLLALPAAMQQRRDLVAATAGELPQQPLHGAFVQQAQARPEAVAVVAEGRTLSYGELLAEALHVAQRLEAAGLRAGQPVAVVSRKGWEQVVAVFGVLLAGGAYMPVDADLPTRRKLDLLRIGEVQQVLTQPGAAQDVAGEGGWTVLEIVAGQAGSFGARQQQSLQADLGQLAYVIFTSGTTGVPKGVMIDHRGAVNTCLHVSRLFGVSADSRVLGVSSLSFDLSVYDIFGVLAAGGTLVLPHAAKGHDPLHWRELMSAQGVNLWNSAPQLMQMLMDSFPAADDTPLALQAVLMSGDFIPLTLPGRIRERSPRAQVISLGGATEASIWSNFYPVAEVQPQWTSIPYGRALPNQTMTVCDHAMRTCPDHARGRIFIGGIGLAQGYWRDPAKTGERFVTHPVTGERLYDTGDLGRYAADGNILIVGRDDGQVKIRGHRIELGEVDAVLRRHPAVKQAVASATGKAGERRHLVAHVELERGASATDVAALQAYVGEHLPDYMVPQFVAFVERMPVSANGKVDRQALPPIAEALGARTDRVAPRNPTEQAILDIWSRVFVGVDLGVTDNFFELGGDSLLLTQLLRELNEAMPFPIEVGQLYQCQTTEQLAQLYQSQGRAGEPAGADAAQDDEELEAPLELLA